MRKADFDFAMDLLTQAELHPDELALSVGRGIMVNFDNKGVVGWLFNNDGEFMEFSSSFAPADE